MLGTSFELEDIALKKLALVVFVVITTAFAFGSPTFAAPKGKVEVAVKDGKFAAGKGFAIDGVPANVVFYQIRTNPPTWHALSENGAPLAVVVQRKRERKIQIVLARARARTGWLKGRKSEVAGVESWQTNAEPWWIGDDRAAIVREVFATDKHHYIVEHVAAADWVVKGFQFVAAAPKAEAPKAEEPAETAPEPAPKDCYGGATRDEAIDIDADSYQKAFAADVNLCSGRSSFLKGTIGSLAGLTIAVENAEGVTLKLYNFKGEVAVTEEAAGGAINVKRRFRRKDKPFWVELTSGTDQTVKLAIQK